jgi:uncharacterized protein DUF4388
MGANMSTDESLSDHSLPEVVAILAQNKATGRLLINLKSAKAFFYFDKGELAAARMGPLTGLPAVNLALAMNGTKFQFDPGFEIPPRDFKDPHEISLLNQLLATTTPEARIDGGGLDGPSTRAHSPGHDEPRALPIPYLFCSRPSEESESPSNTSLTSSAEQLGTPSTAMIVDSSPQLPATSPAEPQVPNPLTNITDNAGAPAVHLVGQSGVRHAGISVRASSTLLLLAVIAVGITALRSKARAPVPSSTVLEGPVKPSGTTKAVQSLPKEMPALPVVAKAEATKSPTAKSSPQPTAVPEKSPRVETTKVMDGPSATVESRPTEKPKPAPSATGSTLAEAPSSKLPFTRVPVVIRIENGFVAEAYIKTHQPGLEAFEATALRIARQRRYPKETTGVETIVVQMLTEP